MDKIEQATGALYAALMIAAADACKESLPDPIRVHRLVSLAMQATRFADKVRRD